MSINQQPTASQVAKMFKDSDFVVIGYIDGLYKVFTDGRREIL